MRRPHFLGLRLRQVNLDQLALPDARTQRPGLMPTPTARQQLRPKREGPALDRLHRMDTAPPALQKYTLGMARNPQAEQISCTERKPFLELSLAYPDKFGNPLRIGLERDPGAGAATAGPANGQCRDHPRADRP